MDKNNKTHLHVRNVSPHLISSLWIIDHGRTIGDWSCPRDLLVDGEDGVEVEDELGHGEDDHDEGGGRAAELLHVGKHSRDALQCRHLFRVQSVVLQNLWKWDKKNYCLYCQSFNH